MPDEGGDFTDIDQDVVRQKDEQLAPGVLAPEAHDVLGDRLFGNEMGAIETTNVVTPQTRRTGDPFRKIFERFRLRLKAVRQLRALVGGKFFSIANFAQQRRRRAQSDVRE
ncbi:MAG: hypothetical protein ACREP1_03710, partial [Rhodanobacteraceae bacterium]